MKTARVPIELDRFSAARRAEPTTFATPCWVSLVERKARCVFVIKTPSLSLDESWTNDVHSRAQTVPTRTVTRHAPEPTLALSEMPARASAGPESAICSTAGVLLNDGSAQLVDDEGSSGGVRPARNRRNREGRRVPSWIAKLKR